jgi:hypothetical protein
MYIVYACSHSCILLCSMFWFLSFDSSIMPMTCPCSSSWYLLFSILYLSMIPFLPILLYIWCIQNVFLMLIYCFKGGKLYKELLRWNTSEIQVEESVLWRSTADTTHNRIRSRWWSILFHCEIAWFKHSICFFIAWLPV